IYQGKITGIAERLEIPVDCEVLDASGQVIMPGMVDVHVHFNEPALGDWEGFTSGSVALAAGGCTTYVDMPLNGQPPTTTLDALKLKSRIAEGSSLVDYAFWGGLVPGNLDSLEALADAGVVGFKAFMSNPGGEGEDIFRQVDDETLFAGMKRIAAIGGILALHAENEPIVSRLAAEAQAQGRTGARDFAASRPAAAELAAVLQALAYAEQTGCALHFVHISSHLSVEAIERAKLQGLDVTLETCPHYLILTTDDMERLGPVAKCAPPLRSKLEQEQLWMKVTTGQIDLIASDHSPCPTTLKQNDDWFQAWGGISGAQSSLELIVGVGHLQRGMPLTLVAQLLATAPAKRFGLYPRKGVIALGADADLAIVDLNHSYTLSAEQLHYRHNHSPYIGRKFDCRVTTTLCRGQIVYQLGKGPIGNSKGMAIQPTKLMRGGVVDGYRR
ncbi:MAG: allantoinase AllB, partial [Gorillibacterium sp.]|nr:allantoinase AllB [Gorillibacterium sp.]